VTRFRDRRRWDSGFGGLIFWGMELNRRRNVRILTNNRDSYVSTGLSRDDPRKSVAALPSPYGVTTSYAMIFHFWFSFPHSNVSAAG
jgi:hypothetical protein